MKYLFGILLNTVVVLSGLNAQPVQQWFNATDSPNNSNETYAFYMQVDASGNTYVGGTTWGGPGNNDIMIRKYNTGGVIQWTSIYDSGNMDAIYKLLLDGSGNIFIIGHSISVNMQDIVVLKYNNAGVQQWVVTHDGYQYDDFSTGGTLDAAGNIYATGTSYDGTHHKAVTLKYNTSGALQWFAENHTTPSGEDYAQDIAVDAAGNCYVVGYHNDVSVPFKTTMIKYNSSGIQQWILLHQNIGSGGTIPWKMKMAGSNLYVIGKDLGANGYDAMLLKYSTAGSLVWDRYFNGPANGNEFAYGIDLDPLGNIYVCGDIFNGTNSDGFTLKYDNSGVLQWSNTLSGPVTGNDEFADVVVHPNGYIYVAGFMLNSTSDFSLVKYSASGTVVSQTSANGPFNNVDQGFAMSVDPTGYIYICGVAYNGNNFDFGVVKFADILNLSASQSQVNVSCNGNCNGSASVVVSGGVPPYTYSWSPLGGTSATASSLCAGFYTCTITDSASNQITATFNITQPPALTITPVAQTNLTCYNGNNGAASVSVSGGTPSYTYNWSPGNPTGDGTNSVSGLGAGTWTCTVTDANGCTGTQTFNILQGNSPTPVITVTNAVCSNGTGWGWCGVIGGTGPYTYSWAPSGITTPALNNVTPGCYTVTVTDINGCTGTGTACITSPPSLTITSTQTNIICNGACTGSASVSVSGGTTPYTYAWAPGNGTSPLVNGRCAGAYTCTVTDANACTATHTIMITQPPTPVISTTVTNVSCFGSCNGSATVTGVTNLTGPYSYAWNPNVSTTATASNLCAGTYTVTITGASGCTAFRTLTITSPPAVFVSVPTATPVACNGGNTGALCVTASGGTGGPYTFAWSNGGTAPCITNIPVGCYTVTVTDANGCTGTANSCVTQPPPITPNPMQNNISCNGGGNGHLMVSPSGGTPGYNYSWSPIPNSTNQLNGSPSGTYTCTITDQNGCTGSQTFTLTEPPPLITSQTHTNLSCFGSCDGTATVNASGGAGGYAFNWSPSGTGQSLTGLCAGVYICTVTDLNGCTAMQPVNVTQPAQIVTTSSQTNVLCFGGFTGAASVNASGGNGPYSYAWSPAGGNDSSATGLNANTYSCVITDNAGCSVTHTVLITEPSAFSVVGGSISVACYGDSTGSINLFTSGATAPYTWQWSNGDTTEDISGLSAGSYTLTITDASACSFTTVINVGQPATPLSLSGLINIPTTCVSDDGSIDLTPSGGTTPYSIVWNTGDTTEDLSAIGGGIYSVTITDNNNCVITSTYSVIEPGTPAVTFSEPVDSACRTTTASFALTGALPAGGYWSGPGVNGNMFDPTLANTGYNVITYTYTDSAGCSGSAMDSVWVDLCLAMNEEQSPHVALYPNPTDGKFTVTAAAGAAITVYDAGGKLIFSGKSQSDKTEIDLGSFSDGIFLIRIQSVNSTVTERIILCR